MSNDNNKQTTSRHGATDPEKCREMEKKYGWKLLRFELTKDQILKVDCVFEGETEFPTYQTED
ncbi:MAG TPA: hypothetical protein V6D48_07090 [Oculatellaceae cyanobacterium]